MTPVSEYTAPFERRRDRPTAAESVLWAALRGRQIDGLAFRRQYPVGPFVLDVYCPDARLAVEVDDGTPEDPEQTLYLADRERCLATCGVRVVHVRAEEVVEALDGAVERIRQAARRDPVLRGGVSPPA